MGTNHSDSAGGARSPSDGENPDHENPKRGFASNRHEVPEKLKNISRPSQAGPRWIPVATRSRQLGLGADRLPTTSLRCAKLCLQQVLGEEHRWFIFAYCRGSSGGRVPKAWFDIWGLRPGRCFNLENYDVALARTE